MDGEQRFLRKQTSNRMEHKQLTVADCYQYINLDRKAEGEILEKLCEWLKLNLTKNNRLHLRYYHLKEKNFKLIIITIKENTDPNKHLSSNVLIENEEILEKIIFTLKGDPQNKNFWLYNSLEILSIPGIVAVKNYQNQNIFEIQKEIDALN